MKRSIPLAVLLLGTSAIAQVTFTNVNIPDVPGVMGAVDMNNDGRDDLVVPDYTNITIAYQQANGTYTVVNYPTTPANNTASWSFAVGDWDDNGHRDLMYGGGSGATFMKANADGSAYTEISPPQYIFCQRTNFVDINNDGHLDAFSCHDVDANVAFLNDGNGNLVFTQGGYGTTCGNYGSIFTDVDNDGDQDLFIAKCGCDAEDLLMLNDGSGAFSDIAGAQGLADWHQSWSSAWGDFDNDGDMDALIGESDFSGVHKLLRNDGGVDFTEVTTGSGVVGGSSIEWTAHDFDNDGWIDILGGGQVFWNNGDWTFTAGNFGISNLAVGDLDSDGYLDIAQPGGYSRNNGSGNNWIRILPMGVASNRDAIGARVKITTAAGSQIRDVRSGDGFSSMSFIGAHFGLGSDGVVEEVEIHWPSGEVDVLTDVAINTTHVISEGTSTNVASLEEETFRIAPNPVLDIAFVHGVPPNTTFNVYDATGKLVLSERLQGNELNVTQLVRGAYQVEVRTANGPIRTTLIKR